ncbi:unnamed protein product [Mytilus coruscus]|uniref:C1q domain-containing protein n=1 Tax=Mytilus coruscus TaxID=42192 RepID=A0A6J8CKU8_MYTCO|nr:unnamed protein product [Mytilus coruscus]
MAELQMKNYEELRQKEDVMYDEIKTTKEKTEINHLAVKPRNQWLKHFLLILLISVFSAGVASAITYLTVCAKLQEKFNIIDVKLAAIERQNGTEHRDNRLQKQINGSTAQLKQFTLDLIEKKLKDVERKSDMKDQEMEKRYNLTSSSLQKQINDSTDLAQLKQFKLDLIEKELKDVERKNQIKEQEMENRYNLTSSRLQKQINDSTDLVGFTAFGSGYDTRSPGYQLKFPVIKSSVGISNLSSMKKHGTFICEKKGLYQVTVTVTICSLHKSGFNIYKNNQLYMEYFIGSLDASFRNCDSGTGTAVVELHVNDALNVRNAHEDVDLFERLSSFSAVRLK